MPCVTHGPKVDITESISGIERLAKRLDLHEMAAIVGRLLFIRAKGKPAGQSIGSGRAAAINGKGVEIPKSPGSGGGREQGARLKRGACQA